MHETTARGELPRTDILTKVAGRIVKVQNFCRTTYLGLSDIAQAVKCCAEGGSWTVDEILRCAWSAVCSGLFRAVEPRVATARQVEEEQMYAFCSAAADATAATPWCSGGSAGTGACP